MIIEVSLPCGTTTKISQQDKWILEVFPIWRSIKNHIRVMRKIKTEYGFAREEYYLHRLILGAPVKGFEIDHIDRDGLNNTRENLRLASRGENTYNKDKAVGTTSKYRGVACKRVNNRKNPWTAYISKAGKRYELGYFKTEKEAALAYDEKARELWGSFAFQNISVPSLRIVADRSVSY